MEELPQASVQEGAACRRATDDNGRNRLDAGLIVMASRHRDGPRTLLAGSIADKIVHNADRSVLVVRSQT